MGFTTAIRTCLSKYADFSGRARRSEFWFFRLFVVLSFLAVLAVVMILGSAASDGGSQGATGLAVLIFLVLWLGIVIPDLAVAVRRLHDTDKSGLWLLLAFVPFGGIVLFVFFCIEGTRGPNRFGPDPLESHADVFR